MFSFPTRHSITRLDFILVVVPCVCLHSNVPAGGQDDIRVKPNYCGCVYGMDMDKKYNVYRMGVQVSMCGLVTAHAQLSFSAHRVCTALIDLYI